MKESITKKHTDMSSLQKIWMRVCVLVVMATQVTLGVSQNLTVDGYSTAKVCPGEPIVLQATSMGSGVTVVDVYRSYNGQDGWMQIGSVNDPTGVFKYVVDMGNQAVWFKIREQNPDKTQSQLNETNAVKVEVETQCARLCHQSSSGDYINGTDFNVLPLNTTSPVNYKPAENANIESYFSDYDVRFQINQCSNGRAITNDVESYLGYLPKANESQYSNYYWVSNDNYSELNCAPFTFLVSHD